ncbi:hypothetical protein BT69DRAFT_93093 [Atractiella rhizophila]|nr:hypothetical protein BT69DRAFT_93093 [Atractiella rhizophila]
MYYRPYSHNHHHWSSLPRALEDLPSSPQPSNDNSSSSSYPTTSASYPINHVHPSISQLEAVFLQSIGLPPSPSSVTPPRANTPRLREALEVCDQCIDDAAECIWSGSNEPKVVACQRCLRLKQRCTSEYYLLLANTRNERQTNKLSLEEEIQQILASVQDSSFQAQGPPLKKRFRSLYRQAEDSNLRPSSSSNRLKDVELAKSLSFELVNESLTRQPEL